MGHYVVYQWPNMHIVAYKGDPVNKSVPLSGRIPFRLGEVELLTNNIVVQLQVVKYACT